MRRASIAAALLAALALPIAAGAHGHPPTPPSTPPAPGTPPATPTTGADPMQTSTAPYWQAFARLTPAGATTGTTVTTGAARHGSPGGPGGRARLRTSAGGTTVALVVRGLAPSSRHSAHIHQGSCDPAKNGPAVLTLPDVIADEFGTAALFITLPTAAGTNYATTGFYLDIHAGFDAAAGASAMCGDIQQRPSRVAARIKPAGTSTVQGAVWVQQQGTTVDVWLKLDGLAPGTAHGQHLLLGTCAAPGTVALALPDATADSAGRVRAHYQMTSATSVTTGTSYAVHEAASPTLGAVTACGDLAPFQFESHGGWWHRFPLHH